MYSTSNQFIESLRLAPSNTRLYTYLLTPAECGIIPSYATRPLPSVDVDSKNARFCAPPSSNESKLSRSRCRNLTTSDHKGAWNCIEFRTTCIGFLPAQDAVIVVNAPPAVGACAKLYDLQELLISFVLVLKQILFSTSRLNRFLSDTVTRTAYALARLGRWYRKAPEHWSTATVYFKFVGVNGQVRVSLVVASVTTRNTKCSESDVRHRPYAFHRTAGSQQKIRRIRFELKPLCISKISGQLRYSLNYHGSKAGLTEFEKMKILRMEVMATAAVFAPRLRLWYWKYLELEAKPMYFWSDAEVVLEEIRSAKSDSCAVFVRNWAHEGVGAHWRDNLIARMKRIRLTYRFKVLLWASSKSHAND